MANNLKKEIEKRRQAWEKTAKEYGWYTKPFFIQVWLLDGKITDSVSFKGLDRDIIINQTTIK